jgi:hypothetical protein
MTQDNAPLREGTLTAPHRLLLSQSPSHSSVHRGPVPSQGNDKRVSLLRLLTALSRPEALQQMYNEWKQDPKPLPDSTHPPVFPLTQTGCDRHRAQMVLTEEGYGMEGISPVVNTHMSVQCQEVPQLSSRVSYRNQCRPGANTFAWQGSSYKGLSVSVVATG